MDSSTDYKLKEAFSRIKQDMDFLKEELNKLKKAILEEDKDRNILKNDIKEIKSLLSGKGDVNNDFFLVSSGNKGVFRQFDSSSTVLRQDFDTQIELKQIFAGFTDREFLVFMALYQLEEELKSSVSYAHIANKLGISQSSTRDHINELIRKQAPIEKNKVNNRKILLNVGKSFKNLNLMGKILSFRNFQDQSQTTLLDI